MSEFGQDRGGLRVLQSRRRNALDREGRRAALLISPTPFLPVLGGASARVRTLLKALDRLGFDVHLAFIERDPGDKEAMRSVLGDRFHALPYRRPRAESAGLPRFVRGVAQRAGLERAWLWDVDALYDPSVEEGLARLHARWRFDVVIVEYIFFSRALRVFGPEVRTLLDMHDVFGDRHRMYLAAGQRPEWISVRPRDELRALRRASHVLAIQPGEARHVRAAGLSEVSTVSHFVRLSEPPPMREARQVLFVGSGNEANRRGLRWFLEQVWPQVRHAQPAAEFVVAGAAGDGVEPCPGVRLLGRISDGELDRLYCASRVAVNPVFTGSGQSIKVLEASGQGVPVVATRVGVRGIVEAQEPAVSVRDDARGFADAVLALLDDDELFERASREAYGFCDASNRKQLAALAAACGVSLDDVDSSASSELMPFAGDEALAIGTDAIPVRAASADELRDSAVDSISPLRADGVGGG